MVELCVGVAFLASSPVHQRHRAAPQRADFQPNRVGYTVILYSRSLYNHDIHIHTKGKPRLASAAAINRIFSAAAAGPPGLLAVNTMMMLSLPSTLPLYAVMPSYT